MSDTPHHGGARSGAGRPKGSANATPSKSAQAQEAFAELIRPRLERYFDELDGIATSHEEETKDRIVALKELLNRGMGKPVEFLDVTTHSDELSIDDLLNQWRDES